MIDLGSQENRRVLRWEVKEKKMTKEEFNK